MKERTLGDRLRTRRIKLNLSLKDIEKETNIPLHYLLALELNQFDAVPVEDLDHYISSYAKAVSLAEEKKANINLSVKEVALPISRLNVNDSVDFLSLEREEGKKRPENSQEPVSESIKDKEAKTIPLSRSRRQRYYSIRSWLVGISIMLIFLTGTALAWLWWRQSSQLPVSKQAVTRHQKSSSKSTIASSTKLPQLTVNQDANGATIITLSQATRPITIEVTLSGEAPSWVSLSNTDLSSEGVLLTTQNPSVTAVLDEAATTSQFVFGYPEAVTVTINGQKLDMTTITSSANTATFNVTEGE
ncbi:helix-turn-helix domain-containing protein [Streptococcus sciuri]|uniref:Helix-turn-helix domain-containing protein n=1 Tax=Streptococcus sciuri TaxID=2973939 RepID=A0ABT2F6Z8_9STRE|nr:helix-turn-helix domain-containing protein [Streptococcus sciuri]MCS4487963.1 helix-turn-helix domain-containing protein [Streptococcus sciuri]